MRTSREPSSAPNTNQKSTIRGVRFIERPGRENAYGVQWPEREWDDGKKAMVRKVKTLFFPTIEARETKAVELRTARRSRMLTKSLSRDDMADWEAFKKAIGDTPWQDVVSAWRSRMVETGRTACTLTVEAAGKTYVAHCLGLRDKQKLSADYFRHIKTKIGLFVEQFGDLTMDKVSAADVVEWIDDFGHESDLTFDNYKTHVRSFYAHFCAGENPAVTVNPATHIKDRSDGMGEVGIISVAQTAQLFHTALNHREAGGEYRFRHIIGRLALEAFVGLRFASGCRLEPGDIKREDKGILLPKKKLKTKRRHYIDGLPENVWAWIDLVPKDEWHITPRQYMGLKSELFSLANVPHPRNCLRHSFATYHVAAYKDAGKTAYLLCHRNQDELYEHYKGNATEAQGRLYQTITPETVEALRVGFEPAAQSTP
jgi:integrase